MGFETVCGGRLVVGTRPGSWRSWTKVLKKAVRGIDVVYCFKFLISAFRDADMRRLTGVGHHLDLLSSS